MIYIFYEQIHYKLRIGVKMFVLALGTLEPGEGLQPHPHAIPCSNTIITSLYKSPFCQARSSLTSRRVYKGYKFGNFILYTKQETSKSGDYHAILILILTLTDRNCHSVT